MIGVKETDRHVYVNVKNAKMNNSLEPILRLTSTRVEELVLNLSTHVALDCRTIAITE